MAASPGGRWATIGLLAAATFLVFMPALRGGFIYDSRMQVLTDPFLHDAANWPAVLSGRVLGMDVLDFNRPAMLASLMLDAAIWGKNPFGYHLTSVLLHVLNVVLVWLLLDRLLVGRTGASGPDAGLLAPAVIGALVFAVHPIVSETVCEPSYREDLLVATFTLAALVIALAIAPSRAPIQSCDATAESASGTAWRVAACVGCAFLAIASKESGVVLPPLLLVAWGLFGQKAPRRFWGLAIGGTALVVVAFLAARFLLEPAESRIFGKPIPLGGSLGAALAIQPRILALDAQLILWPFNQSADYQLSSLDHLPLPRSILILALLTAALAWGARHDRRIGFAAALIVLSILPVANLWPIFQPAADRYLYLPMVGVATIVASLLDRPWWPEGSAARRGAVVAAMAAVALLAVGCVRREAVWHDPIALWQDALRKAPNSFTAAWGLGEALFDAGRPKEAERITREAVKLSGGEDGGAWATLAVIVADQGRMAEAQSHLSRALAADPLLADPDERVAALVMERPWAERLKRLLAARPAAASP
jgi:tetratricopeptide (TPR) repeat protein